MFYIQQTSSMNCGFTCLKILLANLSKNGDYLFLKEKEEKAYSYLDIIEYAKTEGLILKGVKFSNPEEISKFKNKFLIVTFKNDKINHAVVIKFKSNRRIIVLDPDFGIKEINLNSFLEKWDKTALIVESFEKTDFKCQKIINLDKKSKFLYFVLNFLSLVLIIVGLAFININSFVFTPVILVSLGVILEIFCKQLSIKLLNDADETFYSSLKSIPKERQTFIKEYEKAKTFYFSNCLNLLIKSTLSMFVILTLILNNYLNIILIALVFIISIFDYAFIKEKEKNDIYEIGVDNKKIFLTNDIDSFTKALKVAHEKSYKFAASQIIKKYVYSFLIFLCVLLIMISAKIVSLPFVILYFSLSVLLLNNLNYIFNFSDNKNSFNKSKCKIINQINDD